MPKTLMQSVVSQLQKERTRLEDELHRITTGLVAFGNVYMHGSQPKAAVATRKKRTISAAGRKRIAAAQRARWARIKGQKVSISARKGRKMSLAARKRIVAAQKARWQSGGRHKGRPRLPISADASDYNYDTKCYCCGAQPPGKAVLGVNVKQLFDLTARVAIVSGGSMGLGRQMAEGLAEMGANLVLCARKKERCEEAAEALRSLGVQTLALGCDVRDRAAIQEVVDATLAKFGRVDILVNNAGVSWGAPVEEMTLEQWDKVLSTNLTGTFLFCQAAGKAMVAQGSGKIINIASVAGLDGASAELQAIGYHASKAGVIAFTKDLACQWAPHNIQVNAIAPGWFPTHMSEWIIEHRKDSLLAKIPAGRFGGDHDLKGAAVFLASDASAYVTGHVLVVDGGLWAGKNKSL